MAGLKELGLDEDTVIVFSSDNGPGPDFKGSPRSLGMRGQKGSLYEGGIRVPFIVRWPGKTPAGRVDGKTLLHAVDLFPTFCTLAGAGLPKGFAFDGEDVSASFLGQTVEREEPIYWEFGQNKPVSGARNQRSPNIALREGKWKLLVNADGTGAELYDLETDRNETENVATKERERTERLRGLALTWRKTLP